MGNHDICKLGLGTNTQSLCIEGLSNGDQEKSLFLAFLITWEAMCSWLSVKIFGPGAL